MKIKFPPNGEFKLLQFTDIHYSDGNEVDKETVTLMKRILEMEQPDFIFVTGDTVFGKDNKEHLLLALEPIIESKIPFSYAFGNHDTEEGAGYEELADILKEIDTCYFYDDKEAGAGVGNHFIAVEDEKGNVPWLLVGMDSGNYVTLPKVEGYDYIKRSQIDWYIKNMETYASKSPKLAALVFMHVPLPEYDYVWEVGNCFGEKREEVCPQAVNSGLFTAMLEEGHTRGVFVGHDHINDYYGDLYGIVLGYGRASGYNTYGQDDFLRGARIFVLNQEDTSKFRTYVRLSDGTKLEKMEGGDL